MSLLEFPPKSPSEIIVYDVSFVDQLKFGETISSGSCTVSVYSGTDPTPVAMKSGSISHTTNSISQKILGGVVGVVYQLLWSVSTNLGETLQKSGFLVVVSP